MSSWRLTENERHIYRRYAELSLPRHTSYPIAPVWKSDYGPAEFRSDLSGSASAARPLSLYAHIPFCERLCYYCACTKEIVPAEKRRQKDPAETLLDGLEQESARLSDIFALSKVHQVHLGGGSPTFMTVPQLEGLWNILSSRFSIAADAEIAIEVDPRITTLEQLQALRNLGFNRVSFGVQDFDPAVQRAVNRLQPPELVERMVAWCRGLGYASINFDLIYGLPFQTLDSMADTLAKTIALGPDRIAFYRLAVIPEIFRWQNVFKHTDLPAGDLSLDLNLLAINRFLEAGYEFIGLDHFARPTEALARARQEQALQRNFQGMTTGKNLDLIALGPSGISLLEQAYAQNFKGTSDWRQAVGTNLAVERGLRLTADDRIRRELLQQLYSYGTIVKCSVEEQFSITFDEYFAAELKCLLDLSDDGLVVVEPGTIRLTTPLGRLLVRVVAAVFDRYLPAGSYRCGLPAELTSKVG